MLRLIVDEFWRLQRERVGERELADAKAYMTGSFPLTIETPDAIATQVLNVLFYGLPVEQLQSFRERVNAVTADDIAARRALLPAARSAVDRARRQRRGVRPAAPSARLRHVRDDRDGQPRPDDAGLQEGQVGQAGQVGQGRAVAGQGCGPQAVPCAGQASYQQTLGDQPAGRSRSARRCSTR